MPESLRPLWEAMRSPDEDEDISAGGRAGDQARLDLLEGRSRTVTKVTQIKKALKSTIKNYVQYILGGDGRG